MKITIYGLTISSSWGNGHATPYRAIVRALHHLGHEVTFFEKDVEYYYWRRDFSQCNYCKLILYPSWDEIRKIALAEAADSDAVIVGSYCPEGARIADELLSLARPLRIFYDLDTPITLARIADENLEYLRRDQMAAFDLYLSFTGGRILKELEQNFGVRCARALHGCVDPDVHMRVSALDKFRCDLSYMGTYSADRQDGLDELFLNPAKQQPKSRFVLAGALYPKDFSWPANLKRYDHVAPTEHPALYSSSRATLNITRNGMSRSGYCPSGRFFEAAACGTPILSDWFEGLDTFFRPAKEILVVNKTQDVLAALNLEDASLRAIARCARERTMAEHTGNARALQLINYMEEAHRGAKRGSPERMKEQSPMEVTP